MKFNEFKNAVTKGWKLAGLNFLKFFQKYYLIIAMALVTIVALVVRYVFVLYPTGDTVAFILGVEEPMYVAYDQPWMIQIDQVGFSNFYTINSDYSPLFLFVLAIMTLLPKGKQINVDNYYFDFYENRMIYFKTMLFVFAIAFAIGMYFLAKEITKDKTKATFAYILATILPSLFVNSTIWGNADIIYVTFLLYSFYFAIKGKSELAFVFFGLAFANKLQAIFILPFLVYLLFKRKLKLWNIILVPLVYFATFLPAFFFGASLGEPFKYLTRQFQGQSNLTYGAATIWKFFEFDNISATLRNNAPWISILGIGGVLALLLLRNPKIEKKEDMFKVGIFLTMVTIFLLPRLHERYFLIVDCLLIIYALIDKKKIYLLILMQVSSAIVYYHYLARYGKYLFDILGEDVVTIASLINLFIIVIMGYDIMRIDHKPLSEEINELNAEIKELSEPKQETQEEKI